MRYLALHGWLLGYVSALTTVGCAPDSPGNGRPAAVVQRVSLDDAFQQVGTGELEEPRDHMIGNVTDAVVGPGGQIILADFMQREVRAYDRRGKLLGIFGRAGQGPGEYLAPTAVSIDPTGAELGVNDMGNNRVSRYEVGSRRFVGSRSWAGSPVITHSIILGDDGRLILLGTGKDPTARPSFQALLMGPESASTETGLVPLPRALQAKPLAMNVVHAVGDQATDFVYLGLNAGTRLYRADREGRLIDSLILPAEVMREVQLPDTSMPTARDVQELMKSTPWLWSLTAINDSLVLLEIGAYSHAADSWHQSHALLRWSGTADVAITPPCDCRMLGHLADTVLFLRGGPPEPYRLEWRVVRVRPLDDR